MAEKRLTAHNGRAGSLGAYSTKHNDRSGGRGDNIDPERTHLNGYWMWDQHSDSPSATFDECEAKFYAQHFGAWVEARNAAARAARHLERCITPDKLRRSEKSCPEETIYQIGSKKEGAIEPHELAKIVTEFRKWRSKEYPNVKTLNLAIHNDENTPHVHERVVWLAHDKDGYEIVGQAAALREMGVQRPFPGKKEDRYNNAKMTYTETCRNKLLEICRAHDLEIIEEPAEPGKKTLDLKIWQAQQEEKRIKELEQKLSYYQNTLEYVIKAVQELADGAKESNSPMYEKGVELKQRAFSHDKEVVMSQAAYEDLWRAAHSRDEMRRLGKQITAELRAFQASFGGQYLSSLEQQIADLRGTNEQLARDIRYLQNEPSYEDGYNEVFDAFQELVRRNPGLQEAADELQNILDERSTHYRDL